MRRLVAIVCLVLLPAGCNNRGAPVMVAGTVVALGGVKLMMDAQSDHDSNSCEHECWPELDFRGPAGVLLLLTGAALTLAGAAVGAVDAHREPQVAENPPLPAPIPPPPPLPPPPRLSADDPRRTGVWREVPAVYGDDGAE